MDLNAPLGTEPPKRRRSVAPLVGAAALALALGGFGFYLFEADPRGGEPYAVAIIPPAPPPAAPLPPSAPDPTPTGSIGTDRPSPTDSSRIENGVRVVSPSSQDGFAPHVAGPLVIDVSKALDGNARRAAAARSAPNKVASTEDTFPRTNAAPRLPTKPRVAIFIGGMGLDAAATRTAIDMMPAAVSLAFVPYGTALEASLASARGRGHEILLQLPMQTGAGTASGPHTLHADETPPEMARDLAWLMGRFDGYVGVTNWLGASVTGNHDAMKAVLQSVGQHRVFYCDDGTSPRSLATSLASGLGVPAVQADVVLDATADPDVVRANLNRLASIARTKGVAIGMSSGFPDHLPAIARFAADLDGEGLTLVPVSVIANGGANLATTR